jgi:hypothetical protein
MFPTVLFLDLAGKAPRLFEFLHDVFERLSGGLPLLFILYVHAVNVRLRTCGNAFGAGRSHFYL